MKFVPREDTVHSWNGVNWLEDEPAVELTEEEIKHPPWRVGWAGYWAAYFKLTWTKSDP